MINGKEMITMANKPTVVFIPARCNKTGKEFFIREDLAADGAWVRTYGITTIPSDSISGDENETVIDYSNHRIGPQYKCPHCGNKLIFLCKDCGHKACCHDGSNGWYCPISGKSGSFSAEKATSITGSSGQGQ